MTIRYAHIHFTQARCTPTQQGEMLFSVIEANMYSCTAVPNNHILCMCDIEFDSMLVDTHSFGRSIRWCHLLDECHGVVCLQRTPVELKWNAI